MRSSFQFALCLLLLVNVSLAYGQETTLQSALSGTKIPFNLTLGQLDATWRTITPGNAHDVGGDVQMYAALLQGAVSDAYYTQGQTVAIGGETYLIAYRRLLKPIDYAALMRATQPPPLPKSEPATPATVLILSLLNLHTMGSLTDIQPFDLTRVIKESRSTFPAMPIVQTAPAVSHTDAMTSLSNLKHLSIALFRFVQDNDETLPPMDTPGTAKNALLPYADNTKVFVQPGTDALYQPNPSLSRHKLAKIVSPEKMVAYFESIPCSDGTRGVVFVDGHAKRIGEREWPRLKRASKIPDLP